jgi:hypothetical protein
MTITSNGGNFVSSPKFEKKRSLNNDIETQEHNYEEIGNVDKSDIRRMQLINQKPQTANAGNRSMPRKLRSSLN